MRRACVHLAQDLWRAIVRRKLRLSAMHQVLRELKRRGVQVDQLCALEVFGGTGEYHVSHYARHVASLEVWEIQGRYEPLLRRNLPRAEIRITDSYREVLATTRKYDMVVVDNPLSVFGGHCEHFDLLPHLFRIVEDRAIVILNVVSEFHRPTRRTDGRRRFNIFTEAHLAGRASFYGTAQPEQVTFAEMARKYGQLAKEHGYHLDWYFVQSRQYLFRGPPYVQYFVLQVSRPSLKQLRTSRLQRSPRAREALRVLWSRAQDLDWHLVVRFLLPKRVDTLLYVAEADLLEQEPPSRSAPEMERVPLRDGFRYQARVNGTVVHRTSVRTDVLLPIQFGYPHLPVIGDSWTNPEWRDQGIFTQVLSHVIRDTRESCGADQVYILVSAENAPSIRAIERAGFQRVDRLRGLRWGPFILARTYDHPRR